MKRSIFFVTLLFISVSGFAQQNSAIRIFGRIPDASDDRLYQIQIGSFKIRQNAEGAYGRLLAFSLNPSYERYLDFTRVLVKGISAREIPSYIEKIRSAGFFDILIKVDPDSVPTARLSVWQRCLWQRYMK